MNGQRMSATKERSIAKVFVLFVGAQNKGAYVIRINTRGLARDTTAFPRGTTTYVITLIT